MARPRESSDADILSAARSCFLKEGPSLATGVIAKKLGISQATLFNRFGSKEALLIAALGPPKDIPWLQVLDGGPDDKPIEAQLAQIAHVILDFFEQLMPGMSLLRAAGISPPQIFAQHDKPPPVRGHRALTLWLQKAQEQGLIRACHVEIAAQTFLGALQSRVFISQLCGEPLVDMPQEQFVDELVHVILHGIASREKGPAT